MIGYIRICILAIQINFLNVPRTSIEYYVTLQRYSVLRM